MTRLGSNGAWAKAFFGSGQHKESKKKRTREERGGEGKGGRSAGGQNGKDGMSPGGHSSALWSAY